MAVREKLIEGQGCPSVATLENCSFPHKELPSPKHTQENILSLPSHTLPEWNSGVHPHPQVSRNPDISHAKSSPFSRMRVGSIPLEGLPSPKLRSKEHASFPCLGGTTVGDPSCGEELDPSRRALAPKGQSLWPWGTGEG